jgi:uncharacterized protein with HEPN domain
MQRDPRAWLWDVRESAHGIVDHDTVWNVIQQSLAALREAVETMLRELEP